MVDFWMTMGSLVTDPLLGQTVTAKNPDMLVIGLDYKWRDGIPGAAVGFGKFLKTPTTDLRDALNNYFKGKYGAGRFPISLYTSAKLCQLIKAPANGTPGFMTAMAALQTRHKLLTEKYQPAISPEYIMFLGL